jgi:hypothetical protein
MMKDPDSVRFGAMVAVSQENGSLFVCGEVNSRNSFGGYTGMLPFVVILDGMRPSLYTIATRAELAVYVFRECVSRGIYLH